LAAGESCNDFARQRLRNSRRRTERGPTTARSRWRAARRSRAIPARPSDDVLHASRTVRESGGAQSVRRVSVPGSRVERSWTSPSGLSARSLRTDTRSSAAENSRAMVRRGSRI